jgi:hypothetical protein
MKIKREVEIETVQALKLEDGKLFIITKHLSNGDVVAFSNTSVQLESVLKLLKDEGII